MENKRGFIMRNGICIGQDVQRVFSTCPLGTVLSFAGQTAPRGFLLCDGASYPTTEYPDLYAVIGNTYGGDTENFNVPDYRETVLVGVGENTTDTIADHDVYELGEFKDDQLQDHTHTINTGVNTNGSYIRQAGTYAGAEYSTTSSTIRSGRKGTTTHGKQKGVTYIIKAFHTNEGVDSKNEVSDPIIEYVDNLNSYSTEETLTGGTWIDGKPIYRKCFNGSWTVPNSTWSDIITVPNIEQLIRAEIMANNNMWSGYWEIANSNVRFYTSNGTTFKLCILEYTKTTD